MFLLGVSLTLVPILGVKSPKNPNFRGMNRRFQAKRAKYWKFHIIETHASISIKFCTTMETIKWSSWVVPIGAQQIKMADGRHFEKNVKSPYLCNRSTDFGEICYSDAYSTLTADLPLKFRVFENPRWRWPPSWKITKIAISLQWFHRSLRNLVCWYKMGPLTAPTVKEVKFHKSKMADGRHFEKR